MPSKGVRLFMAIAGILSLAVMAAPVVMLDFPKEWGEPPQQQTKDLVPLTGGYGYGSSSTDEWIKQKMKEDSASRRKKFPPLWGDQPMIQTRDLRPLPLGYGMGSSTLAKWIEKQAREVSGTTVEEYNKHQPVQSARVKTPIGRPRSQLRAAPIG